MKTIELFKTKNKKVLSKADIIDVFYDLKYAAAEHYDSALDNKSFDENNSAEIAVIEDILYRLPDDYKYDLASLKGEDN